MTGMLLWPSSIPAASVGAAASGSLPSVVEGMSATLVWAIAILAFGVLLMACVLLLLNREPEESAWDAPDGMRGSPGQHLRHLTRLLRSIRAMNSLIVACVETVRRAVVNAVIAAREDEV